MIRAGRDVTVSEVVRALLARCLRAIRAGCRRITIDLSEVMSADTKIVAALIAAYQHARRASVSLRLVPSEAVVRVIGVCRLGSVLDRLTIAD